MNGWPDELRLIAVIAVNALMLAAAWRIARRETVRATVAIPDAILYWLAGQYAVTGLCGMVGMLWPGLILSLAAAISIALLVLLPKPRRSPDAIENRIAWGVLAFAIGYAALLIWPQRWLPTLATDPLVYHVPAAVQWVQAGRISLVDFWYWLPANSYSPLAGSVWIAWWLAPIGNDSLSRFVQIPAWLLLLTASVRLLRDMKVPAIFAALGGLVVILSGPFITQVLLTKDDVAVAAMAVTLLGGLHARRLMDTAAPYRLGITFGLLISLKYPALLAAVVAAPAILHFRWWRILQMRGTLIAGAISLACVMPWLVRNAIITGGNPVYPFFSGNAGFYPDPLLRSVAGVWHMLAGSFHAIRPIVWIMIGIAALMLFIPSRHRSLRQPRDGVLLSLLVGPLVTIVLLVATFPWPEVRYLFSAIAALLLLIGVAAGRLNNLYAGITVMCIALLLVVGTSVIPDYWPIAGRCLLAAIVTAVVAELLRQMLQRATPRAQITVAAVGLLIATATIYVGWRAYLRHPDAGYAIGTHNGYRVEYAKFADMWSLMRDRLPAGSVIAYANTPTTLPLFGFDLQLRVVYAPVRPGIRHLHDLPPVREKAPARDNYVVATRQLTDGADADTWLANLERLKANYLFIAKRESTNDPPELRFIADHPARFERLAENDAAILFRIR